MEVLVVVKAVPPPPTPTPYTHTTSSMIAIRHHHLAFIRYIRETGKDAEADLIDAYIPVTYNLPADYNIFVEEVRKPNPIMSNRSLGLGAESSFCIAPSFLPPHPSHSNFRHHHHNHTPSSSVTLARCGS